MTRFRIEDLHASIDGQQILRGVDLEVPFGEIHGLMGPNGSGKSTLCHVVSGKEDYEVSGSAKIGREELLDKSIDERARLGLVQAFQYPVEIRGVTLRELMLEAAAEVDIDDEEIAARIDGMAESLDMGAFLDRSVNDDLSGGEKKRSELFQLGVLAPRVAMLDEIDSGLDIDAVRQVAGAVEAMRDPERAVLLITHYNRIFRYLQPDRIHVIMDGTIVVSGGPDLADDLERGGYRRLRERLGITPPETPSSDIPDPSQQLTDTPFDA
ncbi:MAG: Fe-S cluster assembly ATPase SufC [Acidimicrobiia bacterium]